MTELHCRMSALLPEYAAGSLADPDRDQLRRHLADCPRCPAELAAWQAIAAAAPPAHQRAPDPAELVRAVLTRSALAAPATHAAPPAQAAQAAPAAQAAVAGQAAHPLRHLRYLAALVLAEARLIRLAVPVASALVLALGVGLVLIAGPDGGAGGAGGDLLALVAPIVAAAGVAGAYRSRRDPAAELVAATPTSGRLLLLVRLTLVLGYDLLLALAASAVLAVTATTGPDVAADLHTLIGAWLGPMALLCSLSLFIAVRFGPDVALGTAVGLWALRVLASGGLVRDALPARLIVEAWTTNAVVLAASVALGITALVAAGRSGPFTGEPNRGWRATHPM